MTRPPGRFLRGLGEVRATLASPWALVSLATLLYWTGSQAVRPLVALELSALGASDRQIGVLLTAYPLSSVALAIPGGRLVDRLGSRWVLGASLAGLALVGVGYAFSDGITPLVVLFGLSGMFGLGTWLTLQALISAVEAGPDRARHYALFSLSWGLGLAAGPFTGATLYGVFGFASVGLLQAACCLLGLTSLRAASRSRATAVGEPGGGGGTGRLLVELWRLPPIRATLIASFVALFLFGVKESFYPLYLQRAGFEVQTIGALLSLMGVTVLLVRLPLVFVQRLLGSGTTLIGGVGLAVVAMAATPWLPTTALLAVAAVVIGCGLGVNPPISVQLVAQHAAADRRGVAMGMRLTVNRVAQIIQPALFGALAAVTGLPSAFAVSGAMLFTLTGLTVRTARAIDVTPPEPEHDATRDR